MKAKKIKSWIFISMLFVGISLTVYAVAPGVSITSVTVANVTSTTADIIIAHKGVTVLLIKVNSTDDGLQPQTIYPGTGHPDEEGVTMYSATGLTPNTIYAVEIIATGFPEVGGNANVANQISAFRTAE